MLQIWLLLAVAGLVGIDQATKLWAAARLEDNEAIQLIPGVFELRYAENRGVAFSLLQDQRWLFIPMTILVAALIVVLMFRSPLRRYKFFNLVCVLILAGAVGNLIDRVFYGYVIDFLYFRLINFPIFNFADCCVVIGAILMFIFVIFGMKGEEDTPLRTLLFGIPTVKKESSHD